MLAVAVTYAKHRFLSHGQLKPDLTATDALVFLLLVFGTAVLAFSLLTRRPYLRWDENAIELIPLYGQQKRYQFADYSAVLAHSFPRKGGYDHTLILRPLDGGTLVMLSVRVGGMRPDDLQQLATEINLARGLPVGLPDPLTVSALQKAVFDLGTTMVGMMIYAPLIMMIFLLWAS